MKFNINDNVRVKLTDHGRDVHAANHARFWRQVEIKNKPAYVPPKEDENGWSTWQLWSLMEAFGPHIGICEKPCFETEIELLQPNARS